MNKTCQDKVSGNLDELKDEDVKISKIMKKVIIFENENSDDDYESDYEEENLIVIIK